MLSVGLTGVKCSCPSRSAISLDNYTGASPLHRCTHVDLTGAWISILVISWVNCTGVFQNAPVQVTSDQPAFRFSSLGFRLLVRCTDGLILDITGLTSECLCCCRLCASVKPTRCPLCTSVQPVVIYRAVSCAVSSCLLPHLFSLVSRGVFVLV